MLQIIVLVLMKQRTARFSINCTRRLRRSWAASGRFHSEASFGKLIQSLKDILSK